MNLQTVLVKKPSLKEIDRPKITQVFMDVDMRNGHEGLSLLAKKFDIDPRKLPQNHMLVFINRKQTHLKVFVAGNIIAHTKRDRISLDAIREIPRAFAYSGRIDYDEALKNSLEEKLKKRNTK